MIFKRPDCFIYSKNWNNPGQKTKKRRKKNIMIKLTNIKLTGVTFGQCQDNIRKYGRKETGSYSLVREPENQHDQNAIKVNYEENQLGYVSKEKSAVLAPLVDSGKHYKAQFVQQNLSTYSNVVGLTVNIVETNI
jgi:hypothetical protein